MARYVSHLKQKRLALVILKRLRCKPCFFRERRWQTIGLFVHSSAPPFGRLGGVIWLYLRSKCVITQDQNEPPDEFIRIFKETEEYWFFTQHPCKIYINAGFHLVIEKLEKSAWSKRSTKLVSQLSREMKHRIWGWSLSILIFSDHCMELLT